MDELYKLLCVVERKILSIRKNCTAKLEISDNIISYEEACNSVEQFYYDCSVCCRNEYKKIFGKSERKLSDEEDYLLNLFANKFIHELSYGGKGIYKEVDLINEKKFNI